MTTENGLVVTQVTGGETRSYLTNPNEWMGNVLATTDPVTGGIESWSAAGTAIPYIKKFGLATTKADGVVLYTCAMTNGSNVVSCSDGAFTSADVGKHFTAYSMNTSSLVLTGKISGTITAVNSPTQVQLSTNATATVASANGRFFYGTDRGAEVAALLTDVASRGGYVELPSGLIASSIDLIVPGGCTLVGQGADYPSTREFLARGTALIRVGTFSSGYFVQLGANTSNYASGEVSTRLMNIGIDAAERADAALRPFASRSRVTNCTIWRGLSYAVQASSAADCWLLDNVFAQMNVGHVIQGTGDMHLMRNHIRGSGNGGHQVLLSNVSDFEIAHNHMFKGGVGTSDYSTLLGNNIYLRWTGYQSGKYSNGSITDNIFDGTAGNHVQVDVGATGACNPKALKISDNHFFQNVLPDNTYSFIGVNVSSGSTLSALNVTDNVGIATLFDVDTHCYKSFIDAPGAGTIDSSVVSHNNVSHCLAGISGSGLTPTVGTGTNIISSAAGVVSTF